MRRRDTIQQARGQVTELAHDYSGREGVAEISAGRIVGPEPFNNVTEDRGNSHPYQQTQIHIRVLFSRLIPISMLAEDGRGIKGNGNHRQGGV